MTVFGDLLTTLGAIELLRPAWLLALLPLALLLPRLGRQQGAGGWHAVVDPRLLPHVTLAQSPRGRGLALGLVGTGLVVAVIALAGPALPGKTELAYRTDAARVLVVDLSPAMTGGKDGARRVERMRLKLLDLLQAVPQGQTALIAYAEEPYLVAPPTTDTATIALLVPELAPDVVPLAGDRPERALRMATDVLARNDGQGRDVVWIIANPEPSEQAARAVAELAGRDLRLSVLDVAHAPSAAPPALAAAAARLREATEASGGVYVALRDDGEDVRALVARLDGTGGTVAATHSAVQAREIGVWLLPLLLPLAALVFRRGVLLALAAPLLLVPPAVDAAGAGELWLNRDQQAKRILDAGEPARAAALFVDPRWRAAANYRAGRYEEALALLAPFDDADSHYNRGNALARLDRLDDALAAYDAALRLRPDDPDARHNHDLVRERLKQRNEAEQSPERERGAGGSANDSEQENPKNTDSKAAATRERSTDADGGTGRAGPAADGSANAAPTTTRGESGRAALPRGRGDPQREADLLAEQWLRRVPDEPGDLLRRKLMLEHQRRESGELARPWQ